MVSVNSLINKLQSIERQCSALKPSKPNKIRSQEKVYASMRLMLEIKRQIAALKREKKIDVKKIDVLEKKYDSTLKKVMDASQKTEISIKSGGVAEPFQTRPSYREHARKQFSAFIEFLIQPLSKQFTNEIFVFYGDRKKYDGHCKRLPKLYEERERLSYELKVIQAHGTNINPIQAAQKEVLDKRLIKLEEKIKTTEEKKTSFEFGMAKGVETREILKSLGGQQLDMKTPDGVHIDGMFLDAMKFRETLKEAGGQEAKIEHIAEDTGKRYSLSGIAFKIDGREEQEDHIVKLLNTMNAFAAYDTRFSPGSGWAAVQYEEGGNTYMLIVDESAVNDLTDGPIRLMGRPEDPTFNFRLRSNEENRRTTVTLSEMDVTGKASGTVILNSGAKGVYEMHKQEIMYYLLHGSNVMAFNFRGYGLSEGRQPTMRGLNLDVETAYRYVKERTGDPDSKIAFKAKCLSGGPMSHCAAKHPDTNIFLDQTYSDIRKMVEQALADEDNLNRLADKFVGKSNPKEKKSILTKLKMRMRSTVKKIVPKILMQVAPRSSVAENIKHVNGYKSLLYMHDDIITPIEHVEENFRAMATAGGISSFSVHKAPGTHTTHWTSVESTPLFAFDPKEDEEFRKRKDKFDEIHREFYDYRREWSLLLDAYERIKAGDKEAGRLDPDQDPWTETRLAERIHELREGYPQLHEKYESVMREHMKFVKDLKEKYPIKEDLLEIIYPGRQAINHFLSHAGLYQPWFNPMKIEEYVPKPIERD